MKSAEEISEKLEAHGEALAEIIRPFKNQVYDDRTAERVSRALHEFVDGLTLTDPIFNRLGFAVQLLCGCLYVRPVLKPEIRDLHLTITVSG